MGWARLTSAVFVLGLAASIGGTAWAQKQYSPGASDTEIKIGQSSPLSGPVSAFSAITKAEVAYIAMVNQKGGVNGRKVNLISLDDSYSPPKALQETRRLVEEDNVLAIFSTVGTPPNLAIQDYLTEQKVPQLFVGSGATRWGDPKKFPWTIGWQPSYTIEAKIYVDYVLSQKPNAKIAVLYANDDSGKDYFNGVKTALGSHADMIVASRSYETSDPSVDPQVIALQASNADVFLNLATPKFTAQAIRKAYDLDWHPLEIIYNASVSIAGVLTPAGLEKSVGLVSGAYLKDPNDKQWEGDPGVQAYRAWMAEFYKDADPGNILNVYGYSIAQTLVHVLEKCGDDLTRENLVKQATSIRDLQLPMLVPGIKINTSPDDYFPIKAQRLQRFDGKQWVPFGEVVGSN
jgi:ABC-type branched-subunit amino acid transport system substrate-binding protein